MEQLSASPRRIALSTAFSFTTGREPGKARQTGHTCVLGSAPNAVGQEQNILEAVPSSMWVSRPSTGSYLVSACSKATGVVPPSSVAGLGVTAWAIAANPFP